MQEDPAASTVSPFALGGAITGILVLIASVIYLFFRSPSSSSKAEPEEETSTTPAKSESTTKKPTTAKATKQDPKAAAKFTHPWLCASLRAHSGAITGLNFSHNDKYLASAAEGNVVILLSMVSNFGSRLR